MAAFQFIISPPVKKPAPTKVEIPEELPKLILAPFNPIPEVKFGEVNVYSKSTKSLTVYNPATMIFTARFGNVEIDDRIFINTDELMLHPGEEKEICITWSPIHNGYFRKTVRIYDVTKKARSFDIVLRGMAITSNKTRKLKINNKINFASETRSLDSTVTIPKKMSQKMEISQDIRRQTYTIDEKENFIPDNACDMKSSIRASSPVLGKDVNINVLQENSTTSQGFLSGENVDGVIKYSKFVLDLGSEGIELDDKSSSTRRSTVVQNKNEKLLNTYLRENGYERCKSSNLLSFDEEELKENQSEIRDYFQSDRFPRNERRSNSLENIFIPNKSYLSDSLECTNLSEPEAKNVTFNTDVFLTPQKKWNLDSLIISPKSEKSFSSICTESTKLCKRKDLLFISPPSKSKRNRKHSEGLYPYRTGSSAISDRKKHLKTSFMARKRTSPNSVRKNRIGPRNLAAVYMDKTKTIENIKTNNSLKQAVSFHCYTNDPFLKRVLYNDDIWVEKQEKAIINWLNSLLVPPVELSEENNDWTVDAANVWLKSARLEINSSVAMMNIPPCYSVPQTLNILRKRWKSFILDDPVMSVFKNLTQIIGRKIISVREDRDLLKDEGIKKKILQLLSCYNAQWLRIGLEAVYNEEIAVEPRADIGGLGRFVRRRVLPNSIVSKNKTNKRDTADTVKKNILLNILKLIYFLDQARIRKLIRHNRCLFNLDSKYKSSQDLLSAFCVDLIIGRSYVMKHLKAINYNLQYKQTCVDEYDYRINTLDDLRDGVRLTRLCEILFMETDLCSKLRVPAIDIENKKHNVEIAMKLTKTKCMIEGNITAEDIVLGNRIGSRMKTLSFLWQIINNYVAPLYEKAATRIQKWWRIHRLRKYLKTFIERQRNRSAVVIQSAWRAYKIREQFKSALLDYTKRNSSAIIIQRKFRAHLLNRRERYKFQKTVTSVIVIQRWFRCQLIRKKFVELKMSVVLIQRYYRSFKLMQQCRHSYRTSKNYVIVIQRLYKANVAMKRERNRYLILKSTTVNLQRAYRNLRITKSLRRNYLQLKSIVLRIQQKFRANRLMKLARYEFLQQKSAIIKLQHVFKANKLMKIESNRYQTLRNAVIKIQRQVRASRTMKLERDKYLLLREKVIVLQRKFRARRAMKICRSRYLDLKLNTMKLQRLYRANMAVKTVRCRFLKLKCATVSIQRHFRANRLMRIQRNEYTVLRISTIFIQQKFRARKLMKLERSRYIAIQSSVIVVQQKFRAKQAARLQRHWFLLLRKAVVAIQRKHRASLLIKKQRSYKAELELYVIKVQKIYRASLLMKKQRCQFQRLKTSTVVIQRWYRACKLMRECQSHYLKLKFVTIAIQQWYMAVRQIKSSRIFVRSGNSVSVFTSQLRWPNFRDFKEINEQQIFQNMLTCRMQFIRLRLTVVFVQNQFRAKSVRNYFLDIRGRAILIQRWWRSVRSADLEKRRKLATKKCIVEIAATKIQATWRGYYIRKKIKLPVKTQTPRRLKENVESKGTLGERYKKAIYQLKTSDLYNVINLALWNLETVTTFSAKLCEGVAEEGIVPIIFSLISRGNRSEPSLELYRTGFSILINLARYLPTRIILWENMDKVEDVLRILHIMKITHDKFLKKNDSDVFRYSATLLWLLCQEDSWAQHIANVYTVRQQIQKMLDNLKRKCPCVKKQNQKTAKILPKTETDWYADLETRTFSDHCFAVGNIYCHLFKN